MCKGVSFFFRFNLVKAIHVELTYKRSEITMLKMFGKYLSSQSVDVLDDEALAVLSPGDDVIVLGILH